LVPTKTEPLDVLLAIATDLLAQTEAQHRTAIRLEDTLRRGARDRATRPPTDLVRDQLRVLRDLFEAERGLIDELERQLSSASRS